jgi:helicase
LRRCRAAKAIEVDASRVLTATPAGRLCAAGGYSIDHLVKANTYLTDNKDDIPASVIFWALETDSQVDTRAYHIPRLSTLDFRSGKYQEALRELATQEALGPALEALVQGPGAITYDRCVIVRRCLACYAWISAIPLRRINENFPGVTGGAIRNTADVCAWLISLLAELARIVEPQSDRYPGLRELCERLSHGATQEALALCRIRDAGLARDDRNHLVEAGISTLDDVLARTPQKIPLPRHKALRLIAAAETTIEDSVERRMRFQCSRLGALGVESSLVEKLYEKAGRELEFAVDDLLKPPFIHLVCQRVTRQREGEPDHLLFDAAGNVFAVQTTANEKKNVTMTKAVTVIGQSARHKPAGYIVIGRPDFESLAIKNAEEQTQSGQNYKLFPVSTLAEMFVLFHEKKLTSDEVAKIFVDWQGYVPIERVTEFVKTQTV